VVSETARSARNRHPPAHSRSAHRPRSHDRSQPGRSLASSVQFDIRTSGGTRRPPIARQAAARAKGSRLASLPGPSASLVPSKSPANNVATWRQGGCSRSLCRFASSHFATWHRWLCRNVRKTSRVGHHRDVVRKNVCHLRCASCNLAVCESVSALVHARGDGPQSRSQAGEASYQV
jgi:hypothetical protein